VDGSDTREKSEGVMADEINRKRRGQSVVKTGGRAFKGGV